MQKEWDALESSSTEIYTACKPSLTHVQTPITALCPKQPKARSHKYQKVLPRRGYIAKFRIPPKTRSKPVLLRSAQGELERNAHRPTGMRFLDVGILPEVLSTFRCNDCIGSLALYEETWIHGWHTFFIVKSDECHKEHATFPSSRSLDIPRHHACVNVPFTPRDMNEVTMRSVMAVHSTGMSWRSLHKVSSIFDMLPPVQSMPSPLHQRVDCVPSPEPNAINVTISFDSSWKTRGFYSNIGFGAVISTDTKKGIGLRTYESSLREELCLDRGEAERQRPNTRSGCSVISRTATETTPDLLKAWSQKQPRGFGDAPLRKFVWFIRCLSVTEIQKKSVKRML